MYAADGATGAYGGAGPLGMYAAAGATGVYGGARATGTTARLGLGHVRRGRGHWRVRRGGAEKR